MIQKISQKSVIPDFPGLPESKKIAPLPPKYLEVRTADGKVETVEIKVKGRGEEFIVPDRTTNGSRVLLKEKEIILNAPMKVSELY